MTEKALETQNPETEHSLALYTKRAVLGRIALALRTGLAQLIILGGTVVLARYLTPSDFGTFAMVQFVLTVFTLVGDAGLGGALVQKSEKPTERELSTVFFAQLGLSLGIFILTGITAEVLPFVFRDLPPGSPWLLRALALNFVLTSMRVVPTLLLERELLFVRVSILDTVNSMVFYLVAAVLALLGHGVWALVLGVVMQGAVGLLTALLLRPWRPILAFDREVLRKLLGFGVPFQARAGLSLGTRATIPLVGGTVLGSHAVGLLNWSLETAFFPLTFMEILSRVAFPLYSRLKESPEEFSLELEKSLRLGITISMFLGVMFIALAEPLTVIIYSAQWLEAVPALRWYAFAMLLGTLIYLVGPAMDALGKPRYMLYHFVFIAIATWVLAPLGLRLAGVTGFACGYAIGFTLGGFVAIEMARRVLPKVPLLRILLGALPPALVTLGIGHQFLRTFAAGPFTLVLAVGGCVLSYVVTLFVSDGATASLLLGSILKRKAA